ncbi:MAG: prolipoprotein diacylglyceryl transferase [Ruminococcaceae bacterium]|nr:prolipoprotein diacylglyceryl transferase [Oscillospiraceae bacterium]
MFPNDILPGIDLYLVFLCLAVVSAIVVARLLLDKLSYKARLQNFCIYNAVASIIVGYFSAVLFQAVYNIPKYGKFQINSQTGATFYGGLIGGAAFFLLVYFLLGRRMFGKRGIHITGFFGITDVGAACIAIAHGFGRIGCLMAGCCHGAHTDAWYGIYMPGVGDKVVPIQLYETIFLFALFALIVFRIFKKKTYNLSLYMGVYGVWRFLIEYARDDYRGFTFISFLTPSQLTAVLMIIGSVVLFVVQKKLMPLMLDTPETEEQK